MENIILGIETSCDETSAAIIRGNNVLSNIISSQTIHEKFGGVVPELASRAHIRFIIDITEKAIIAAGIKKDQIEGIAVTYGPGLVGALLVGLNFAKGLAVSLNIPFVGINHIEGHIYGNFLSNPEISFPHLSLVVSGGHTQLVVLRKHLDYTVIGKTRDDAVGEAFDKAAKMLGLPYPGGPVINTLAEKGDDSFHNFPRAYLKNGGYDFSYSGLKTSLLVYLENQSKDYIKNHLPHICASYQKAAVEVLVKKTTQAAIDYKIKSVGVVGGVAANTLLRTWLNNEATQNNFEIFLPHIQFCTDNAAMIARAGYQRLKKGIVSNPDLNAYPALKLDSKPHA